MTFKKLIKLYKLVQLINVRVKIVYNLRVMQSDLARQWLFWQIK